MTDQTPDAVNQLLAVCSQSEAAELKVLHNAQIQCLKLYQQEPTAQRKRDWDAAKDGLQECMDRLWSLYMEPAQGEVLKNRLEAVEWLKGRGYKIGKSKFYADVKAKKIKLRNDGMVPVAELERYVRAEGLAPLSRSTEMTQEEMDLEEQKKRKEIEKLDWEIKKREFEFDKDHSKYIPREHLELELASRAGVLDSTLRTRIKEHARDLVHEMGGSPEHVPEFVSRVSDILDECMNEFCRLDRFQVVFENEEEA